METYGYERVLETFHLPRRNMKMPFDDIFSEHRSFDRSAAIERFRTLPVQSRVDNLLEFLAESEKLDDRFLARLSDHF